MLTSIRYTDVAPPFEYLYVSIDPVLGDQGVTAAMNSYSTPEAGGWTFYQFTSIKGLLGCVFVRQTTGV